MANQETKKPTLILDRVRDLEELTAGLAGHLEQELPAVKGALANMVEVLNALITVLNGSEGGTKTSDLVQAEVLNARKQRAQESSDRQKTQLEAMVTAGYLKAVDVVTEQAVVVGREFGSEGEQLGTGRTQIHVSQFTPEAKAQVVGQGVGFVVKGPTGSFEITEVYETSEPAAPTPVAAEPAATTEAVAPAAE